MDDRRKRRGKRYDIATKNLLANRPEDWLALAGYVIEGRIQKVDGNLTSVYREADKVFLIDELDRWIAHMEIQSGEDSTLPRRLLDYNVLLGRQYDLPVRSLAILLREQADHRNLTGLLEIGRPGRPPHLTFSYDILRVWTLPVEAVLSGGLGILPLAPLADLGPLSPRDVVDRMNDRIRREANEADGDVLWETTLILMGLRYSDAIAGALLSGVRNMRESSTYQAILRESREEGLREGLQKGLERGLERGLKQGLKEAQEGIRREARVAILAVGRKRLGEPPTEILAAIERIKDVDRLNSILLATVDAASWDDLQSSLGDEPAR